MRLPLLLTVALALPIGAQGFEGTMTVKMVTPEGGIDAKYTMKGDKMAMTMALPASTGPMAGMEARMLVDPATQSTTILMPLPAGMAGGGFLPADTKGIKVVMQATEESGGATEGSATLKKLGTSQTVAGMKCDDYEVTEGETTMKLCLATGLGKFSYPNLGGGMMGGRGNRGRAAASAPGWAKGLGKAPGFPLKISDAAGATMMEVTSVQKGPVSDEVFTVPAGYVDLQAMMGGRGG